MSKGNQKKAKALGMSYGAAANKLRKMLLFSLVCEAGKNFCYRCGGEILTHADLSIEHKNPWMQAADPVESFFDLNNVAFSHLACNSAAASRPNKVYDSSSEQRKAKYRRRWDRKTPEERKRDRRERYEKYGK